MFAIDSDVAFFEVQKIYFFTVLQLYLEGNEKNQK